MKIFFAIILCNFYLLGFSQNEPKKVNKHEQVIFVSAVSGNLENQIRLAGFGFGAEFQYTIQHIVHSYSKTQGDQFRNKPFYVMYQPSLQIQNNQDAALKNSFLFSLIHKSKRTGPFGGYTFDHLNAGFSFQNELESNGTQLVGIQVNYKLYIPTDGYKFKRLHFHVGLNYNFGLNERSKEFAGLYGEFAFRFRINKIATGGY